MTMYSSDAEAHKCRLVLVRAARDWYVDTERPLVVLPQLQTRYRPADGRNDVRLRPIATKEYVDLLYRVIEFTRVKKAQFCIFPEYSWPVAEARSVFSRLHDLRKEQRAYLLSFEHMTIVEYESLLEDMKKAGYTDEATVREEIDEVTALNTAQDKNHGIVNVCFVALQTPAGLVAVPQRKLRPAALEEFQNQWSFVPGTIVRLFDGGNCRFAVLICFDLIHRNEETPDRPRDLVARERLNYLFVPECNPQPLHDFYFKGAIAMFQSPRWAQHHPIIVTANVAADSDVPRLRKENPTFGFSRMIGRLGSVDGGMHGHYHGLYGGFITTDSPRSLSEVAAQAKFVQDHHVSTLVIRPEQSIALIRLPTMATGPTRDASVNRYDTSVRIYRPIGENPGQWRIVMPIPDVVAREPEMEIPEDLIVRDGLIGIKHLQEQLRELILDRAAPIRVFGGGGTGKSALVATTLAEHRKSNDDRVIWIDLPSVQQAKSIEPLVEAILRKLGRGDAVALGEKEKWTELRHQLKTTPTILVLDRAEVADERDLSRKLAALHSWKTLVIIISQLDANHPPSKDDVVVPALEPKGSVDPFKELILRTAGRRETDLPNFFIEATRRATGGTALGAVWAGQLLKAGASHVASLVTELGKTSNEDGLQTIYSWCAGRLRPIERDILGILCDLPAPVPLEDLHLVIEGTTLAGVQKAVNNLHALGLLIHTRRDRPSGEERLHFRHPFVQQFWRKGASALLDESWQRTVAWARIVSEKYGREGRKTYYPQLAARWSNVAFVLRSLAQATDRGSKEAFLEIWKNIDTFLWITARWRERLEFGDVAVEFAGVSNFGDRYLRLQALALYDALGKTHWHRDPSQSVAERLLKIGWGVAEATGNDNMRARYHWYLSRLLLFREDLDRALEEAQIAEGLMVHVKDDLELAATVKNAIGNVLREKGEYEQALRYYNDATSIVSDIASERADELRDIIIRNRGRLELERGEYTEALEHLEHAMEKFGRAQNIAQQAECAVYHARALAGIDELAEAERELEWAETVTTTIGSAVVRRQIEKARTEIADFRQQRS